MVLECISTVSYQIKFNGDLGQVFVPERGIRQGDPLSPYLFILAAEGLSCLLKEGHSQGTLTGVQLARSSPSIHHLLFADDSMIMSIAKESEAYAIQSILNKYSLASGQRINLNKSMIMFGEGVDDRTKRGICSALNMQQGSRRVKYLGLPGEWQRSKSQALSWLKDKIWQKLQGWKEKFLSHAGKEVLVKSVIQAIPNYIMSCFVLPKSFCAKISSMISNFWWRQSGRDRGIHWKNWQQLMLRKCEGGLGFRDLYSMNLALVAKQVWRIAKSPNALWAQLLKSLYFPNSSIWEAKKKCNASWGWQSLLQGRDFLNKHKAWFIKTGEKVKIFKDKWLQSCVRLGRHIDSVQDLSVNILMKENQIEWDIPKLTELLTVDEVREVLATQINHHLPQDEPYWPYTKDGNYSVKTGYHVAFNDLRGTDRASSSCPKSQNVIWRVIWNAKVQPKIKHFIWRILSDALPSRVNLLKRKCGRDDVCPICNKAKETISHIFMQCDWVRAVWFGSPLQLATPPNGSNEFRDWFDKIIANFLKMGEAGHSLISLFFYFLWSIWLERNNQIFEGRKVDPGRVISNAVEYANEFYSMNSNNENPNSRHPTSEQHTRWQPPPDDYIKINVDAATNLNLKKGAISAVVRDQYGVLLTGTARFVACTVPMEAEALAVLNALYMAESLGVDRVVVETDNLEVQDACYSPCPPWRISSFVHKIKLILSAHPHFSVSWSRRSANKVADLVAKMALKNTLPLSWTWLVPVKIRAAILEDNIVCQSSILSARNGR